MSKYYTDPTTGQRVEIKKTHKFRNFIILPVGGLLALILVIAVASNGGGGDTTTPAPGPVAVQPANPAAPAPDSNQPLNLAFGQQHTWSGGETILISEPQSYTEDNPYLGPPEGKRYVALDVTVRNDGTDEYNVMGTKLTVQHNGRVAQQNYMAGDALPDVELPPGGSTTFTSVYEIGTDPGELQVSVQPSAFAADTAYFTGQF
ncbi:uncharacterized protein DUF4352 [Halopolyspora algeriensis]|uniref:Uncharacterized protein DUF4352 n=1 Tax=Halopolyspora algeriensis TaxID=1500506 RepID=A0A368VEW5_9ACTN|nr:DUF4352 domain-containing protein [Halopolyspora algeriensis]RCW39688.1 uncharacterized protein DUF4352 [Halopolyspora algeriensis]TQM54019.1 uncharacterized protein DUF4352 [Halopolyspora algeriensis]